MTLLRNIQWLPIIWRIKSRLLSLASQTFQSLGSICLCSFSLFYSPPASPTFTSLCVRRLDRFSKLAPTSSKPCRPACCFLYWKCSPFTFTYPFNPTWLKTSSKALTSMDCLTVVPLPPWQLDYVLSLVWFPTDLPLPGLLKQGSIWSTWSQCCLHSRSITLAEWVNEYQCWGWSPCFLEPIQTGLRRKRPPMLILGQNL